MALTALDLPPEALKKYRPLAAIGRRKNAAAQIRLANRRRRALQTARRVAEILYRDFGAKKVLLFGSLAQRGGFTQWSDIDLAAWGIAPTEFYRAAGAVAEMTDEFKIDVVDPATCSASVLEEIEQDGIDL